MGIEDALDMSCTTTGTSFFFDVLELVPSLDVRDLAFLELDVVCVALASVDTAEEEVTAPLFFFDAPPSASRRLRFECLLAVALCESGEKMSSSSLIVHRIQGARQN